MAKYCDQCGTMLNDDAKFCNKCGAPQSAIQQAQATQQQAAPPPQSVYQQPVQPPQQPVYQQPIQAQPVYQQAQPMQQPLAYAGNGQVRNGIPAPGYSDRINDPEIVAAMKKNRRRGLIIGLFIIPLPLLGFIIYGKASGELEMSQSLLYGGIVSGVFLLFMLFSIIKERAKNTYDAVVTDKKQERTYRHKNNNASKEMYTEYTTYITRSDGKKKKILEHEGSQIWAYNYLEVGDRFRYHPEFHFPYELYDKSKAPYIACVSCITKNPKEADRCKKCGLPLLK